MRKEKVVGNGRWQTVEGSVSCTGPKRENKRPMRRGGSHWYACVLRRQGQCSSRTEGYSLASSQISSLCCG